MEQFMKQYYRQVRELLPCPQKDANRCIADIRRAVERLQQEQPEMTPEEIKGFLGEPQDVAQMFIESLDPIQIDRYRHRKKLFSRLLACVLAAMLLTALYSAYYFYINPRATYTTIIQIGEAHEIPDDEIPQ